MIRPTQIENLFYPQKCLILPDLNPGPLNDKVTALTQEKPHTVILPD